MVISRTLDDKHWTVAYLLDDGPVQLLPLRPRAKKRTFLFSNRKDLEGYPLVKMHPLVIKTRDGLKLVSYLTLPQAADPTATAAEPAAADGAATCTAGPGAATAGASTASHQWLANRGYAVLSVNFRGSTGFGKEFVNAGNKRVGRQDARRPDRRGRTGPSSRRSPTRTRSRSWAAATAATPRWSA